MTSHKFGLFPPPPPLCNILLQKVNERMIDVYVCMYVCIQNTYNTAIEIAETPLFLGLFSLEYYSDSKLSC